MDEALQKFRQLKDAAPTSDTAPIDHNESCTRLQLIDPMLSDVLGWSRHLISTELYQGGKKGRLDYVLKDEEGVCWFVIEAKPLDDALLDLPKPQQKHRVQELKLSGPLLKQCKEIITQQMSAYLGEYNPEYAGLTNGEQWVLFLHHTRPAGEELSEAKALVFRSLDAVEEDFDVFYRALAFEHLRERMLQRRLGAGRTGAIQTTITRRVVPVGEERMLSYQGREEEGFYEDLESAMDIAFRPILDNPDALEQCFVETPESRQADSRLERLATELQQTISSATEDYPRDVRNELDGPVANTATSLPKMSVMEGQGYLARILGEPSSGKSVFLKRFFRHTLADLKNTFVLVEVDVEKLYPFDAGRASHAAREQLESELFGNDGMSWEELKQVYYREWKGYARPLDLDDTSCTPEQRAAFIKSCRQEEASDPHKALQRYLEFTIRNRRRLPVLVIDNLDGSTDEAHAVLQWAIARHRGTFALTTLAMEDTTLWALMGEGRDILMSHAPSQFWLPRPRVREVIERRCAFMSQLLTESEKSKDRTTTWLGHHRRYQWSVNGTQLTSVVSSVLLDDEEISRWIGRLCNFDIASILELCRQIVLSPHVQAEDLLSMQKTAKSVPRWKVLKAIIAPRSHQYLARPSDPVTNIFSLWVDDHWLPLLPARILAFLRHRENEERNQRQEIPGFFSVERLLQNFQSRLSVSPRFTRAALSHLTTVLAIEPYRPQTASSELEDERVRITPRGRLHLDWALEERTYLRLMLEVAPLPDLELHQELANTWKAFLDAVYASDNNSASACERTMISRYVGYLLAETHRVSPLPAGELSGDLEAIRQFEERLGETWTG